MTDTGNPPTLWSRDAPWVHVLPEEMDPVALVASIDRNDEFATLLDAERMRDTESLFREFVCEFQFPKYFGWNWPAFHECMRDLTWLPAKAYRIVIRNGPVADDPNDLTVDPRE